MSGERSLKRLWSTPNAMKALGCTGCQDEGLCGGQTMSGAGFNCLDNCCGKPASCQIVCPNAHVFVDRVREVQGFELATAPGPVLASPTIPPYLPMMFHGSALVRRFDLSAVAIPLYRFFDRFADCRFDSSAAVRDTFRLSNATGLILSGVAQDHEVERWWNLETRGRVKAIGNFRRLGVSMVTTPNFSLMVDRPRWDDLHSMRRIVLAYHELVSEGQPAALHVNGRTRQDFQRWGDYVSSHPEITHIAYEFTTGTRNPGRMQQHAEWLAELSLASSKRLGLLLRGGSMIAARLGHHFDVSFIDSSPFEKAQHRMIASLGADGQRYWEKHPTMLGEPVDGLFVENLRVSQRWSAINLTKFKLAA